MDDIKLFGIKENIFETLIQTIRIQSPDIGIEFDIKIYVRLIMKNEEKDR